MKNLILSLAVLAAVQPVFAGNVVISRGLANGPRKTHAEALYFEAKAEAIKQLPHRLFTQVSEWRTSIVDVGLQRYVSAEAEFEVADEK